MVTDSLLTFINYFMSSVLIWTVIVSLGLLVAVLAFMLIKMSHRYDDAQTELRNKENHIANLQYQLMQEVNKSKALQQQMENIRVTGYADNGYSGH